MPTWTADELDLIDGADELRISSRRADGSLRPDVRIWVVRSGDDLFVRSAYGPQNGWYRRARASGEGRVRSGRIERDVRFEPAERSISEELHHAYHAKYDRYGPRIVGTVVSDEAAQATLRLVPS